MPRDRIMSRNLRMKGKHTCRLFFHFWLKKRHEDNQNYDINYFL